MNTFLIELLLSCLSGIFGAGMAWGASRTRIKSIENDIYENQKRLDDLQRWRSDVVTPAIQSSLDGRITLNEALQRLDARMGIIAKETWDELRRKLSREEFEARHKGLERMVRNYKNGDD